MIHSWKRTQAQLQLLSMHPMDTCFLVIVRHAITAARVHVGVNGIMGESPIG